MAEKNNPVWIRPGILSGFISTALIFFKAGSN